MDLVTPLAQAVDGAGSARWQAHSPAAIIEEAARYYIAHDGPMQGAAAVPPLRSSRARPVKQRQGGDEASSSAARTTSTKRKTVRTRLVVVWLTARAWQCCAGRNVGAKYLVPGLV